MKLKLKIKAKKKFRILPKKKALSYVPTPRLNRFLENNRHIDDYTQRYRFLSRYYHDLFNERVPPNQALELVEARVAYALQEQDYAESKVPLTDLLKRRLAASKKFSLQAFDPGLRGLLNLRIMVDDKKEIEKVSKKKAGKSTKHSVAHLYLSVFDRQGTDKLTDEAIAKVIEKGCGALPSLKSIAAYRCLYNKGKIKGQGKRPDEKVKAVRVKKEEALKAKKATGLKLKKK